MKSNLVLLSVHNFDVRTFNVVEDILSSALWSIWYGMMWFCRYLDAFGYSITIIECGLLTLF